MDPPYRMDLPKKVLEALKDTCLADEETLIIAEEALDVDFSWAGALGYEIVKIKEYKTNKHVFLKIKKV
jgi:16S rRNA G966 N2-methylase RsmD